MITVNGWSVSLDTNILLFQLLRFLQCSALLIFDIWVIIIIINLLHKDYYRVSVVSQPVQCAALFPVWASVCVGCGQLVLGFPRSPTWLWCPLVRACHVIFYEFVIELLYYNFRYHHNVMNVKWHLEDTSVKNADCLMIKTRDNTTVMAVGYAG